MKTYTFEQLKKLGYNTYCEMFPSSVPAPDVLPDEYPFVIKDYPFKDLIELYISSFVDGKLPNFVAPEISDNAPESVKQFFASFTKQNIASLLTAPDDDVAFDSIIPRGSEYSYARDVLKSAINKYSTLYKDKHNGSD